MPDPEISVMVLTERLEEFEKLVLEIGLKMRKYDPPTTVGPLTPIAVSYVRGFQEEGLFKLGIRYGTRILNS